MSEEVETQKTDTREVISFQIGDQEFCVDIMCVREIRGWTTETPLPNTPQYIRGVINLRGAVLPVIDLAGRMGLADSVPSDRSAIVVAMTNERLVGLLVDEVSDILTISDEKIQSTPDVACDNVRDFVRGLFSVEGRMISQISLDKVLSDIEQAAA